MGKIEIDSLNSYEINKVVDIMWEYSDNDYKNRGMNKGKEYDDFCMRKDHCKKTADIAMKILDMYEEEYGEYRSVLNFACLIHDIRKMDSSHGKAGKEFFGGNIDNILSTVLGEETQLKKKDKNNIEKIIRQHTGKTKDNKEKFAKEITKFTQLKEENRDILALILFTRISDKVSKYPNKAKEIVIEKAINQTEGLIEANSNLKRVREKIINNII